MGIFDFVKDAGEKIGLGKAAKAAEAKAAAAKAAAAEKAAETTQANKIRTFISGLGLDIDFLQVDFDDGVATLHGTAPSQEVREKAILAAGNLAGVARVDDQMKVEAPEPEAQMYTVKSGDSLSKIAKQYYGDAGRYPVIFEANRPMLKDPNLIYPGQVLRIPAAE